LPREVEIVGSAEKSKGCGSGKDSSSPREAKTAAIGSGSINGGGPRTKRVWGGCRRRSGRGGGGLLDVLEEMFNKVVGDQGLALRGVLLKSHFLHRGGA
jgi:hypothetical protein